MSAKSRRAVNVFLFFFSLAQGLGTDEETLIEIVCSRSDQELADIQKVYREGERGLSSGFCRSGVVSTGQSGALVRPPRSRATSFSPSCSPNKKRKTEKKKKRFVGVDARLSVRAQASAGDRSRAVPREAARGPALCTEAEVQREPERQSPKSKDAAEANGKTEKPRRKEPDVNGIPRAAARRAPPPAPIPLRVCPQCLRRSWRKTWWETRRGISPSCSSPSFR